MTGYLRPGKAAAYLGVSRRHFETHIAPWLPVHDLTPTGAKRRLLVWAVADLDDWMAARRRERVA